MPRLPSSLRTSAPSAALIPALQYVITGLSTSTPAAAKRGVLAREDLRRKIGQQLAASRGRLDLTGSVACAPPPGYPQVG
jgi:hypothetical protein